MKSSVSGLGKFQFDTVPVGILKDVGPGRVLSSATQPTHANVAGIETKDFTRMKKI